MINKKLGIIDYEQLETEIIDLLSYQNNIVLATSFYNDVRASTINYINDNLNIYFIATLGSPKLEHIKLNNKVSFVLNNLEIDATVEILGNPNVNKWFSEMYRLKFSKTFPQKSKKHFLIQAKILRATLYKNNLDFPTKHVLETSLITAYRFKIS